MYELNQKTIEDMIKLQDSLNSTIVGNNWREILSPFNFFIAIRQEVSEYIDCFDWKWWKHMDVDLDNAKLELVDIWHFLLSYCMLTPENTKTLIDLDYNLVSGIDYFDEGILKDWKDSIDLIIRDILRFEHHLYEYTTKYITTYDPSSLEAALTRFFIIVKSFMTTKDFVNLYYAKNLLNLERTKNGYKDGTYAKFVNGIEDNKLLIEYIKNLPEATTFEEFKKYIRDYFSN